MLSQSMIMAYHATSLWAWNRLSLPNNWQIDTMYRVKIWVQENTKQQNSFHPQSYLVAYIQVATIKYPVMYMSSCIFIYVYIKLLMFYV